MSKSKMTAGSIAAVVFFALLALVGVVFLAFATMPGDENATIMTKMLGGTLAIASLLGFAAKVTSKRALLIAAAVCSIAGVLMLSSFGYFVRTSIGAVLVLCLPFFALIVALVVTLYFDAKKIDTSGSTKDAKFKKIQIGLALVLALSPAAFIVTTFNLGFIDLDEKDYVESVDAVLARWESGSYDDAYMLSSIKAQKGDSLYAGLDAEKKARLDAIQDAIEKEFGEYEIYKECQDFYTTTAYTAQKFIGEDGNYNSPEIYANALSRIPSNSRFVAGIKRLDEMTSDRAVKCLEEEKKRAEEAAQKEAQQQRMDAAREAELEQKRDLCIYDDGFKQSWRVYMNDATFHVSASYSGTGNFVIELRDANREMVKLLCNEIGTCTVDKKMYVDEGKMYYVDIYSTRGSWTAQFEGTYGG